MTSIKAVKIKVPASHQQVKYMWIKSEKCSFTVYTSQPKEPALISESQQPQHGESSIRHLNSRLTSCSCCRHFQKRIKWDVKTLLFIWKKMRHSTHTSSSVMKPHCIYVES